MQWDEQQEKIAREKVMQNSEVIFSKEHLKHLEDNADKHWDAFYNIHQNRYKLFQFFKEVMIWFCNQNCFMFQVL